MERESLITQERKWEGENWWSSAFEQAIRNGYLVGKWKNLPCDNMESLSTRITEKVDDINSDSW